MSTRLAIAIFSTLIEEAALAVIVLFGLPKLGIELPLGVLVALMVAWAGFAVFIYRVGSRALKRKPVIGLSSMIGSRGRSVSRLDPEGFVRIKGEINGNRRRTD